MDWDRLLCVPGGHQMQNLQQNNGLLKLKRFYYRHGFMNVRYIYSTDKSIGLDLSNNRQSEKQQTLSSIRCPTNKVKFCS